jgi:hypothetical protein
MQWFQVFLQHIETKAFLLCMKWVYPFTPKLPAPECFKVLHNAGATRHDSDRLPSGCGKAFFAVAVPPLARKASPQSTRRLKTISLGRMLPGLIRADVLRRLGFYGTLCGLIVSALIYCGSTGRVFAAGPERGRTPLGLVA